MRAVGKTASQWRLPPIFGLVAVLAVALLTLGPAERAFSRDAAKAENQQSRAKATKTAKATKKSHSTKVAGRTGAKSGNQRLRAQAAARANYHPPSAAIVVDVNSGQELYVSNADELRHPASLTKIMTLYLLFEQLGAKKLALDSELPISAHAAAQAPTKLGLAPGQTITVEDAIKALVTKSANDIAVAIAEALGGDEPTFARKMTRKAHALGMAKTVYVNASGLPDPGQVTTAREQAILARAIQDRFPQQYRYFSMPAFHYRGRTIANHNRLLGRVEGVDGIKTGFTLASGYNLASSVRRGKKHLVAVVLGGSSASSRDTKMEHLIEDNIEKAAAVRTAPVTAETVVVADDSPNAPDVMAPMAFSSAGIPGGFAATQPDLAGVFDGAEADRAIATTRLVRQASAGTPDVVAQGDAALADEPTEVEQNSVPVEEAAAETSDRDLLQPMLAVLGGSLASVFGLQLVIFRSRRKRKPAIARGPIPRIQVALLHRPAPLRRRARTDSNR